MQQDGKILLSPSWNVQCEKDLICIDYHFNRCVEGWIETALSESERLSQNIETQLLFRISFQFHWYLLLLPGLVPVSRFSIWNPEKSPQMIGAKKTQQYLDAQPSGKTFYSNLKFISSIQMAACKKTSKCAKPIILKLKYQLNVKIKRQNYFYTEANPKKLF